MENGEELLRIVFEKTKTEGIIHTNMKTLKKLNHVFL